MLVVLRGTLLVNYGESAGEAHVVVFARAGTEIAIEGSSDATLLLPSGEPIVGQDHFAMYSQAGIARAIADSKSGRYYRLTAQ